MITPTQMKQKIKNIQTKTGIPAQLLQRNFIMERFLFRLNQSASQRVMAYLQNVQKHEK